MCKEPEACCSRRRGGIKILEKETKGVWGWPGRWGEGLWELALRACWERAWCVLLIGQDQHAGCLPSAVSWRLQTLCGALQPEIGT